MQDELQHLEHQQAMEAFREFINGRIDPVFLGVEGQKFFYPHVQLVFEAFCTGRARTVGQQLFAGIKESSKYHSQIEWGKQSGYGYPFPVRFQTDPCGYVIKGGVGGQYRLEDVELYVIEDGEARAVLL